MSFASVAVLVCLLAVVVAGAVVVRRLPADLRRQLLLAMIVALALRVVLAAALHALGVWQVTHRGAVTPDEAVIDYAARLRAGGDERSPVLLGGSLHTVWLLVATGLYELWGSLLALKLVNAVLGTLLLIPVFLLGQQLHSHRAGLWAAWGTALFPPAVVWSALALREPLIALVITTFIVAALRLVGAGGTKELALACLVAVLSLLVLAFTRSYMVPLMVVLAMLSAMVAAVRSRTFWPVLRAAGVGLAAVTVIALLPTGQDLLRTTVALAGEQAPSIYNPFSDCSDESACLPTEGGPPRHALGLPSPSPAPGEPVAAPSQLSDSLQSVGQKGLVRALLIAVLAGRPVWRTEEFFFLLQPGVVVWWTLLPLVGAGAIVLARHRELSALVLAGGLVAAVVVFLAYSGQFIRHHFMLEPVALVLAAIGAAAVADTRHRLPRWGMAAACAAMAAAAVASVTASLVQLG